MAYRDYLIVRRYISCICCLVVFILVILRLNESVFTHENDLNTIITNKLETVLKLTKPRRPPLLKVPH